ncbi:phage tail assembly chaperone [Bradyrhizobium sp. Bra64]|uniref:phage tail assembly chaperone n=1 Tax=Bradyrhizobium sp. Bra64 TaxID=2926009 RepID=UPI0021184E70|nr:phage tail assembly chaperone [Bradyrhizobium sp. Bra64]
MRLAANFALQLGSKAYVLRPTLRAAFHLHQKYGFPALYQAVAEGSFTAIMDLITATSDTVPVASVRSILDAREQLLEFVLILSGADTSDDKPASGKPMAFDEYFTRLFQLGTGWLGWSPETTWNATTAEILSAREGRMEMLQALFGGKREEETANDLDSVRDRLNAIGDLNVHSLEAI